MRWFLAAIVICAALPARAEPADTVALLPLDADQRLEIYGQPVASRIASALVAGGVDVVVVGRNMAVPDRALLIIDGTITSKGSAVTLAVRVRDRENNVLETLAADAPQLVNIDRAAAELSTRLLPSVTTHLAKLRAPKDISTHVAKTSPAVVPLIIAVGGAPEPLRAALAAQLVELARAHHREARPVELAALAPTAAQKTITASGVDLAIVLEVVGYSVDGTAPSFGGAAGRAQVPAGEAGKVPSARARVRMRVVRRALGTDDRESTMFDRVIATDTIVGDRNMPAASLAARTAREVLAIAQPQLHRVSPTW